MPTHYNGTQRSKEHRKMQTMKPQCIQRKSVRGRDQDTMQVKQSHLSQPDKAPRGTKSESNAGLEARPLSCMAPADGHLPTLDEQVLVEHLLKPFITCFLFSPCAARKFSEPSCLDHRRLRCCPSLETKQWLVTTESGTFFK